MLVLVLAVGGAPAAPLALHPELLNEEVEAEEEEAAAEERSVTYSSCTVFVGLVPKATYFAMWPLHSDRGTSLAGLLWHEGLKARL